jgi:transcriptional regulator with XRE-family HTH domain
VERDLKPAFAKTLKELRIKSRLSQQALADYCDLERVYISRLERALSMPSIETIFKIAEVLAIKPSELVQELEKAYKKQSAADQSR